MASPALQMLAVNGQTEGDSELFLFAKQLKYDRMDEKGTS
jgi:hypothetical protein